MADLNLNTLFFSLLVHLWTASKVAVVCISMASANLTIKETSVLCQTDPALMYRIITKASQLHPQTGFRWKKSNQELTRHYYFIVQSEFVPQDESDKTEFYQNILRYLWCIPFCDPIFTLPQLCLSDLTPCSSFVLFPEMKSSMHGSCKFNWSEQHSGEQSENNRGTGSGTVAHKEIQQANLNKVRLAFNVKSIRPQPVYRL